MAPSPDFAQPNVLQLQQRLRLAHQARRAKERQLDDVRHALMDVGVIEEGDPYSHADLADVIRQLDSALDQTPAPSQEPCGIKAQLDEAEALAGRWEEKYFELAEKRTEALAAIDRVQAVAREWEFMSGRREARRELLAALTPTEEQR